MQRLAELQSERERQQKELEQLREAQKKAEEAMIEEQHRQREQQEEMQRLLSGKLKEAEEVSEGSELVGVKQFVLETSTTPQSGFCNSKSCCSLMFDWYPVCFISI